MKKSSFFIKTAILTSSNIITGVLTFLFSIILSRKIGPQGMGLYQLIMPLYSLFLFITGGGITISMSKIAAEKKASGKMRELYHTVKIITTFEFFWSILVIGVLVLTGKYISTYILKDQRTYFGILAFSPAVIIISLSSTYKGVYYGLQRVVEPAIIDIAEKIVRISTMYIFVTLSSRLPIEYRVAAAALSLCFGELTSFILFYIFYNIYKHQNPAYEKCDNNFQLIFNVLRLSLPLGLNGILSTIFSSITAVLIPNRLRASGLSYENSLSLFGKFQGMALNIVFFPAIILSSIGILIIPALSEAMSSNRLAIVNHRINTAFKVTFLTACSSAAIIHAIPDNLGLLFYKDKTIGEILYYMSFTIPFAYFESTTYAILNGLGKQGSLLINSTLLSLFDISLLYILLGIPGFAVKGFFIDFLLCSLLGIFLNMRVIKKTVDLSLNTFSTIILPILISLPVFMIARLMPMFVKNTSTIIITSYLLYIFLYIILTEKRTKIRKSFRN